MREVVQIVRFYIINQGITSRSIESLLDNPNYNPLLKKCVNTIKHYPDWAIDQCRFYRDQIDERKFKFNSGSWAMDIRDEDIPKGTIIEPFTLKQAFLDIINWIDKNRAAFTQQIAREEAERNA
jgi:hypothetical protein